MSRPASAAKVSCLGCHQVTDEWRHTWRHAIYQWDRTGSYYDLDEHRACAEQHDAARRLRDALNSHRRQQSATAVVTAIKAARRARLAESGDPAHRELLQEAERRAPGIRRLYAKSTRRPKRLQWARVDGDVGDLLDYL